MQASCRYTISLHFCQHALNLVLLKPKCDAVQLLPAPTFRLQKRVYLPGSAAAVRVNYELPLSEVFPSQHQRPVPARLWLRCAVHTQIAQHRVARQTVCLFRCAAAVCVNYDLPLSEVFPSQHSRPVPARLCLRCVVYSIAARGSRPRTGLSLHQDVQSGTTDLATRLSLGACLLHAAHSC